MQFLVIINLDNGPANSTFLDANFQRELPKLDRRQNVMAVGYVKTVNGARPAGDVFHDVDRYASWVDNATSHYVFQGIFFDETPSVYTKENDLFMRQIDDYVKHHKGLGRNFVQHSLNLLIQIVHNPGTIPNDERLFVGADLIVASETGYRQFISDPETRDTLLRLPNQDLASHHSPASYAYIFNGVPSNWKTNELRAFIDSIKKGAKWLYMTDIGMSEYYNVYGLWGSNWEAFTQAMASC
jgi:hypothetical protein